MSKTLFLYSAKGGLKLSVIFLAILTLYGTIVVYMYDPELSNSLQDMVNSMPQVFAAFNMMSMGTNLLEFISNYLYGFLLVAFPLIFISLFSLKLVCNYVDSGVMAYFLASPNTRKKLIVTQLSILILSVIFMVLYIMAVILLMTVFVFPGESLGIEFINLNIGLLGLLICFSGICFFSSCTFSDKTYASIFGAGICTTFLLIDMLKNISGDIEFLKYLTPISLFDANKIISGDENVVIPILILYIIGFVFMAAGVVLFCKKDLHV